MITEIALVIGWFGWIMALAWRREALVARRDAEYLAQMFENTYERRDW